METLEHFKKLSEPFGCHVGEGTKGYMDGYNEALRLTNAEGIYKAAKMVQESLKVKGVVSATAYSVLINELQKAEKP